MSSILIAIIGVVYTVVAADLLYKGNTGLGIAFIGYALGNVGLYMEAAINRWKKTRSEDDAAQAADAS
jgi:hypothetical protein